MNIDSRGILINLYILLSRCVLVLGVTRKAVHNMFMLPLLFYFITLNFQSRLFREYRRSSILSVMYVYVGAWYSAVVYIYCSIELLAANDPPKNCCHITCQ